MDAQQQRDPDETAATLTAWLASRPGVESPQVGQVSIPEATGWSNETILFDARWRAGGEEQSHELVARIAPTEHQVFPDSTFLRQHAVMQALAERTDLPMARILWLDEDPAWFGSPCWVMERVTGDIPTDVPPYAMAGWLAEATPAQQEQVWWSGVEAIAGVHRVDVDDLHLPAGTFPTVVDTLGWHLDHYADYLAWAEEGTPHPGARRALRQLRDTRPPDPVEGPCLVWGDARLSNLIYRDFEVVTVLDWEMAGIGDPLLDLGWWLFADHALTTGSGCTRLTGFPSKEATAQRWRDRTGRSIEALDYYELFAGLRFTVIMLRMGKLLADIGLVPPEFARDNLISQAMQGLLEGR